MMRRSDTDVLRSSRGTLLSPLGSALRATVLAGGLTLAGVSGALAQDATPQGMAGDAECVAVEMAMAPAGGMGTPAASPVGEQGEGTPADEALTAEAIATIENYVACYNAGDYATVLALMTLSYILDLFGTDDLAAIESAMNAIELPPTEILSIGDVMTFDDGRISVEGEYMLTEYQYSRSRTYLVQSGDHLLIDGEDFLPAMPDVEQTAIIAYTIADDTSPLAFDQSTTVPAIEGLILYGANNGAERHSVALFRLPDEAAGTPVAELDTEAMMGGEIVGGIGIEPGEREELVLIDLPPGTYLLVDAQVPGSAATLTVTEPAPES